MPPQLQILTPQYLNGYTNLVNVDWQGIFNKLNIHYTTEDFEYYIQSSATYSSNIEGNSIDIDTYLKN